MDSLLYEKGVFMEIRLLKENELSSAIAIILQVFMEFEAPDYSEEGTQEFRRFLEDPFIIQNLHFYGAWQGKLLLGVLAAQGKHICLFFVRKEYHRRGIGRALFQFYLEQERPLSATVNSSPFAQEFYRKLGFSPTDSEQVTHGIRYIPMIYFPES